MKLTKLQSLVPLKSKPPVVERIKKQFPAEYSAMSIMEIAKHLKENASSLQSIAEYAFKVFKSAPQGRGVSNVNEPEIDGKYAIFDLRYWGTWENPEDAAENDDEEDNDWQVLTPAAHKAATEICDTLSKKYPEAKFSYGASEKNYLVVRVSLK